MDNNSLNEVQAASKKIVEELIKVCRENKIRYYALGGTLLGCVRHKGFIPWDDDIDLGSPPTTPMIRISPTLQSSLTTRSR